MCDEAFVPLRLLSLDYGPLSYPIRGGCLSVARAARLSVAPESTRHVGGRAYRFQARQGRALLRLRARVSMPDRQYAGLFGPAGGGIVCDSCLCEALSDCIGWRKACRRRGRNQRGAGDEPPQPCRVASAVSATLFTKSGGEWFSP